MTGGYAAFAGSKLGAGRVGSTGMPYDEFERRAFAPDEDAAPSGRFTRRAPEPERVGTA